MRLSESDTMTTLIDPSLPLLYEKVMSGEL